MSARRIVIERDDNNAVDVDKGMKNGWKWEWLERSVEGTQLGQFMRKLNVPGVALCSICQSEINYSGRGWNSLGQHVKKKKHRDNVTIKKTNHSLSGIVVFI